MIDLKNMIFGHKKIMEITTKHIDPESIDDAESTDWGETYLEDYKVEESLFTYFPDSGIDEQTYRDAVKLAVEAYTNKLNEIYNNNLDANTKDKVKLKDAISDAAKAGTETRK